MKPKHIVVLSAVFLAVIVLLLIGYAGFLENTLLPRLVKNSIQSNNITLNQLWIKTDRAFGTLGDVESEDATSATIQYEPNRWLFPNEVKIKLVTLRGAKVNAYKLDIPEQILSQDFRMEAFDDYGELILSEKLQSSGIRAWELRGSGAIYSGYSDPESDMVLINFTGSPDALSKPFLDYEPIHTGFPSELTLTLGTRDGLSGSAIYDKKNQRFTAIKYILGFGEKDFLSIGNRKIRGLGHGTMEIEYTDANSWRLRISDALVELPLRGRLMNLSIIKTTEDRLDFDFVMEFYYGAFKQLLGMERAVRSRAPLHRFMGKISLTDQSWELSRVDMDSDTVSRAPLRTTIGNAQISISTSELKLFGRGDATKAVFEYDAKLDSGSIRLPGSWDINAAEGRLKGVWNIPVLGEIASAELAGELSFRIADGSWGKSRFSLEQPSWQYRYFPGAERGSFQFNCNSGRAMGLLDSGIEVSVNNLHGSAKIIKPLKSPNVWVWDGKINGERLEYRFDPMRHAVFEKSTVSGTMTWETKGLSDLQLSLETQLVRGQSGKLSITGNRGVGSAFLLKNESGGNILRSNLNFNTLSLSGGELTLTLQDARCAVVESDSIKASMLLIDAPSSIMRAPGWQLNGKGQATICNFIWDKSSGTTVENDCFATISSAEATIGNTLSATIPQLSLKYRSDADGTGYARATGLGKLLLNKESHDLAFELPFKLSEPSKVTEGSVTFDGLILNNISGHFDNMTVGILEKDGVGFINNSVKIKNDGQNMVIQSLEGAFGNGSYKLARLDKDQSIRFTDVDAEALCGLLNFPADAISGKVISEAHLEDRLSSGIQINPEKAWSITGKNSKLKLGFLAPKAEKNDAKNLTAFTLAALENFEADDFSIQHNSDGSIELEAYGHAAGLLPFEYDSVSRSFNPTNRLTFGSNVSIKMRYQK